MVLAQDQAQANQAARILAEKQYKQDLAQYEKDKAQYEKDLAEYNKQVELQKQAEAEKKRREEQSRWGDYDNEIKSLQGQIESAKKQQEALSARHYTTFGAMSYKSDANLSRLRNLQRDLHNEEVRMKAYGDHRDGSRSAKISSLKSEINMYQARVTDKGQQLAKQSAIKNKSIEIQNLSRQLQEVQGKKASAVAEYNAKQKREAEAKAKITSAGNEYQYRKAVWDYRNTDFVSSRGLAKPYMTHAVGQALAQAKKATRGSAINRAQSKAEHLFMGGSKADWDAKIKAEDANRKLALRMSAGLRAQGNAQIKAAQEKELARLGGGTLVSGNIPQSKTTNIAQGTAEKAQDFGLGFTVETKAFGYIASGQAEIDRQNQIKEYQRTQQNQAILNELGVNVNVQQLNDAQLSTLYNAQNLVKPTSPQEVKQPKITRRVGQGTKEDPYRMGPTINRNLLSPALIPAEQRSLLGQYSPQGQPVQGPAQPQGQYQVTTEDGTVRVFKDYSTAQKFTQRLQQKQQTVSLPIGSLSYLFGPQWTVDTPQGQKTFSTKAEAEKFIESEEEKKSFTGNIPLLESWYKMTDDSAKSWKEDLEKTPNDFNTNVMAAGITFQADILNAITKGREVVDKYLIKPTIYSMTGSLAPIVQQPEPVRPVTRAVQTIDAAGLEKASEGISLTGEGLPTKIEDTPAWVGERFQKYGEGFSKQWQEQSLSRNVAQLLVMGPVVAFDIATVAQGGTGFIRKTSEFGSKIVQKSSRPITPTIMQGGSKSGTLNNLYLKRLASVPSDEFTIKTIDLRKATPDFTGVPKQDLTPKGVQGTKEITDRVIPDFKNAKPDFTGPPTKPETGKYLPDDFAVKKPFSFDDATPDFTGRDPTKPYSPIKSKNPKFDNVNFEIPKVSGFMKRTVNLGSALFSPDYKKGIITKPVGSFSKETISFSGKGWIEKIEQVFYHGTTPKSASNILKKGFDFTKSKTSKDTIFAASDPSGAYGHKGALLKITMKKTSKSFDVNRDTKFSLWQKITGKSKKIMESGKYDDYLRQQAKEGNYDIIENLMQGTPYKGREVELLKSTNIKKIELVRGSADPTKQISKPKFTITKGEKVMDFSDAKPYFGQPKYKKFDLDEFYKKKGKPVKQDDTPNFKGASPNLKVIEKKRSSLNDIYKKPQQLKLKLKQEPKEEEIPKLSAFSSTKLSLGESETSTTTMQTIPKKNVLRQASIQKIQPAKIQKVQPAKIQKVQPAKISNMPSQRPKTTQKTKTSPKITPRIRTATKQRPIVKQKVTPIITPVSKQATPPAAPTPQKPKITSAPARMPRQTQRQIMATGSPTPSRRAVILAVLPPPPGKRKKRKSKEEKTFEFLGNTRLDQLEGLIRRSTVIHGDKRIAKQVKADKRLKFKERGIGIFAKR